MIIRTEAARKEHAVRYVRDRIDELNRQDLRSAYHKDPATGIVYYPNCHPDDMSNAEHERLHWQALLSILTSDLPFAASTDQPTDTNMRRNA